MRKTVSQADLDEIEEICYNDGYEIDDIQDAMTVLADDLVKEITEDFEPDILKGVKFIEYQIKFKQDNNEYDIDTPVEPIDTGMPEDCSFYEAKKFLNSKGYILVEKTLNERLNMNQVVGMIDDLEKQDAIILYDMIDPKVAELYVTRSQYDAITVFEEFQEIAKLKKKWGVIKGLGDEDLRLLDVNGKKLIKGYIDKNLPVWKIRIYF
jgi:hypothetical protein